MKYSKYYIFALIIIWSVTLINPEGFLYEDDEGAYLYISAAASQGSRIYSDVLAAKPPMIFLLGSAIYKIAGNNIVAFRYTASVLGLLTALLVFFITRKICDSFGAFICSLLFLLDPIVFTQARLFRTDIFMLFLITASMYFLSDTSRTKNIIYGSVFSALAVLSRDNAVLYVIFIMVFYLLKNREKRIIFGIILSVCVFAISLLSRGENQVIGSFSQQVNISDINILQKTGPFIDFLVYMTKKYPVWLLFPALIIPAIRIKSENHSIFTISMILLTLIMIFVSDSHYIRYALILIITRILITADLLRILQGRYRNIIASVILITQLILNPPPVSELTFRDDTVKQIAAYIRSNATHGDILLADYGYFNFHSQMKGTSISGYISGGNVKTGEINADKVIEVIQNENVKFLLIHTNGRLYYPYGSELYYYEPHHLKGMKDYPKLQEYLNKHFTVKNTFADEKGPVFVLYERSN